MFIATKLHTIFLLIGPEKCGKTTFVKTKLIPELEKNFVNSNLKPNITYISSKDIRMDLLGPNKYNSFALNESSELSFEILFTKLNAASSFPINSEFIILDTSGMSESFRNRVIEISKKNHYNLEAIVFDYKNKEDYLQKNKKTLFDQYNRLRNEVYKTLKKEHFNSTFKMKSLNENLECKIYDLKNYENKILDINKEYIAIGDLHETIDELKELLSKNFIDIDENGIIQNIQNKKILLLGDFVNKGNKILETISFIHNNKEHFKLIIGNHEDLLYKLLTEKINSEILKLNAIQSFSDSYTSLLNNLEHKEMFLNLIENYSDDFYVLPSCNKNRRIFFTHSPCLKKYLGKLDNHSIKEQKHWSVSNESNFLEQLNNLIEEGDYNWSYHIFGHIAIQKVLRKKNNICIDTGSIHGNKLTSVSIVNDKPVFKSVNFLNSQEVYNKPLISLENTAKSKVELNEKEEERISYLKQNKINFISGTMCPADKDEENNELESLKKALEYFKYKGIKKVILEPKYMGNNSIMYLSKEIDKCFITSRNGYKINIEGLETLFISKMKEYNHLFNRYKAETIILAGELMPWDSLGNELISKKFKVIGKCLETEFDILKENGFEHNMSLLNNKYKESGFENDFHTMNKKDILNKYNANDYSVFRELFYYQKTEVSLEEHIEATKVYNEQIKLYGEKSELDFKAFNILKVIDNKGKETIIENNHLEIFPLISKDKYKVIDFNNNNFLETAELFFNELTENNKLEGIVIKPDIEKEGVLPFMKVRNKKYLTIIYGYDYMFPYKFKKLISNKNINKKKSVSLKQHELGNEMLNVPLNKINESTVYVNIVSEMLFENNKEKNIDPRL